MYASRTYFFALGLHAGSSVGIRLKYTANAGFENAWIEIYSKMYLQ